MTYDTFELQSIREIKEALAKRDVPQERIDRLHEAIHIMVKSSISGSVKEIKAVNRKGEIITLRLKHQINRLMVDE